MSQAFQDRILNDFLPMFCTSRSWSSDGFKADWSKISEVDATDFLRGFSGGLVKHEGGGLYRAPRSYASEQFFWSGSKLKPEAHNIVGRTNNHRRGTRKVTFRAWLAKGVVRYPDKRGLGL